VISPGRALVASFLAATTGLAVAQDRPPQGSSPGPVQGKPPVSPSKTSLRHYVTGTLVAIDVEKGTITFKDESGKSLTWPVEARLAEHARAYAEMRLQTLKAGDRVMVIYAANTGGDPRVYDVRPAGRLVPGPHRRDGEARPPAPPASPVPPP
jgi:Cu/Ag efflux protein CusF